MFIDTHPPTLAMVSCETLQPKNINEMYPPMINKREDMLYPKLVLPTLYGKMDKK